MAFGSDFGLLPPAGQTSAPSQGEKDRAARKKRNDANRQAAEPIGTPNFRPRNTSQAQRFERILARRAGEAQALAQPAGPFAAPPAGRDTGNRRRRRGTAPRARVIE